MRLMLQETTSKYKIGGSIWTARSYKSYIKFVIINKQMSPDETEMHRIDLLKKCITIYLHHNHNKQQKEEKESNFKLIN